jgi:hypothetical protein
VAIENGVVAPQPVAPEPPVDEIPEPPAPEPPVPEPEPVAVEPQPAAAPQPAEAPAEPERTFVSRWQYEPPDSDDAPPAPTPAKAPAAASAALLADDDEAEPFSAHEPTLHHDVVPTSATSSFDAALEPLLRRMQRAKLSLDFVRSLLIVDSVIDVGEAAMRWAGMPNKHERALTGEVFFALAEWGFLAPRADGRYRVIYSAEQDPAV